MNIWSLLIIAVFPSCIVGFVCPDDISRVCTCYTTFTGVIRREEQRHVDCSSRQLKQVPYMDFNKGTRLKELHLQNNSITSLYASDFARKVRVHYLDISSNPIGNSMDNSLLKKSVIGLKTLQAKEIGLDLQNVTSLQFLNDMHSLEELDLSRNMEYGVDMLQAIFVENDIHSLKKLSLSLCRIKAVNTHAFIGLNNLRELDLSQNYLSRVPRALNRLGLLRKLTLRENDITVIYHGDFSDLNCLQELDLSKNLLGQMEAFRNGAMFGIGNSLTHFYLHDSHMAFIPTRTLSELKRLTHLDISHNSMTLLTNMSFLGQYRLQFLDISGNNWNIYDDMFGGIKDTLVTLRMRRAGLTFIPRKALTTLTHLRILDLSHNELRYLNNDSITGISARRLFFRGNQIRYVSSDAFSHYIRPIDLDLSGNVLDSLSFMFESDKCSFYNLNITNNGFLCDCQIEQTVNSKRAYSLAGNCILNTGQAVPLTNETMTRDLERQCGKSSATFCLWWAPRSAASAAYFNHVLTVFALYMYYRIGNTLS